MRSVRRFATVVLCCASALFAQAPDPTFKTQSQLVVVPVTVADKTGQRIFDLAPGDFKLLDNGKERTITVEPWGTYEAPVSLVVVVETSSLAQPAILKIRKVASLLDDILGEGGEVAVVSAYSKVETLLNFTDHWEDIQETFENIPTDGYQAAHVLDGVDRAISMLASRPSKRRRVILLICEGHDRGSALHSLEVLTRAELENVTIYTASFSPFLTQFTTKATELEKHYDNSASSFIAPAVRAINVALSENIAKALAYYTGGQHLTFNTLKVLQTDLSEVGKEVHSQYQITFLPQSEPTLVYHEISIEIKDHPNATVRARPGYWLGVVDSQPSK